MYFRVGMPNNNTIIGIKCSYTLYIEQFMDSYTNYQYKFMNGKQDIRFLPYNIYIEINHNINDKQLNGVFVLLLYAV